MYDGAPRQDYEEVLRSIGAFLDRGGMKEVLLTEETDGFIVQGLVASAVASGSWSESAGTLSKQTLTFVEDDIARFMDEGLVRRGQPLESWSKLGYYERAFRVIGRYVDEQKPRDVFFFEQGGAFVVRLLMANPKGGIRHELVEFTQEDIETMVVQAPSLRTSSTAAGTPGTRGG